MAVRTFKYLFCILFFLGFEACTSNVNSIEELQKYLAKEKNGLFKTKSLGEVNYSAAYRSPDIFVNQEIKGEQNDPAEIEKLRKEYGQFAHFIVGFSAKGNEIETYNLKGDFGARVNLLAFHMDKYICLINEKKDTIPVVDYFYQRTFGAGSESDLLFAFDRKKIESSQKIQMIINEFGLGVGTVKFDFRVNDILKVPDLVTF